MSPSTEKLVGITIAALLREAGFEAIPSDDLNDLREKLKVQQEIIDELNKQMAAIQRCEKYQSEMH